MLWKLKPRMSVWKKSWGGDRIITTILSFAPKLGKYAAISSNVAAVKECSSQLGKPISGSTVRGFKKAYCSALNKTKGPEPITRLEHGL